MKYLLKNLGQIRCAKVPQRLSWNQGLFDTLTWGAIVPQCLHLPPQTKPFPPLQSRDDIRPQISKHYWSCTGMSRFTLPLLWISHEKGPAWNHCK